MQKWRKNAGYSGRNVSANFEPLSGAGSVGVQVGVFAQKKRRARWCESDINSAIGRKTVIEDTRIWGNALMFVVRAA